MFLFAAESTLTEFWKLAIQEVVLMANALKNAYLETAKSNANVTTAGRVSGNWNQLIFLNLFNVVFYVNNIPASFCQLQCRKWRISGTTKTFLIKISKSVINRNYCVYIIYQCNYVNNNDTYIKYLILDLNKHDVSRICKFNLIFTKVRNNGRN